MGKRTKQIAEVMRRLEWAQQQWLALQAATEGLPDDALMSVSLVCMPGAMRSTASFSAPVRYIKAAVPAELVEIDKKMMAVQAGAQSPVLIAPDIAAPGSWTRGMP